MSTTTTTRDRGDRYGPIEWAQRTIVHKTTDILLQLYKSLVRPHLEYCISAWSPHYNKDKQLLERIQHRFTHMLPGMKELSYNQRLRKLGLWSL